MRGIVHHVRIVLALFDRLASIKRWVFLGAKKNRIVVDPLELLDPALGLRDGPRLTTSRVD